MNSRRHGADTESFHLEFESERLDDTIRAEAKRLYKSEDDVRGQRLARIPLGRMGEGREVGAVVAFLASERASFVTCCAWNVDGGAAAVI